MVCSNMQNMKRLSIRAFSALGLATLSRAQSQSAAQSSSLQTLTGDFVPFVAFSSADVGDYFQYPATLLGSSGSESTFEVSCYNPAATECFADTGFASMTLVTGPETMEIFFSEDTAYVTTACILSGSPFPTTGTCSETYSWNNVTTTVTTTSVYTVPYTTTSTFFGDGIVWWSEDIYTATLAVLEGAAASTTTTAEATRTGSGSAKTTATPTPTVTSKSTVSGKGSGSSASTQGSESASARTSATKNAAAMTTGAPRWMLVVGAAAGVAVVV